MGFNVIVDPDFVDHWKTRMLVGMLGDDELAPVYVIRLWAHCQNRRMWVFDLPTAALKGVCRFAGDAGKFEEAMSASGFVSREGTELTVIGWDEYNASLIAAWTNGGKGGRPRKVKIEDNEQAGEEPSENPWDNPQDTHGLPMGEPIRGEGIGLEPITSTDVEVAIGGAESPSRSRVPNCPHQRLLELYAKHLPMLPQPVSWEGERQNAMRARWRWVLTTKRKDGSQHATDEASAVAWFDRFFEYIAKSDFLTGRNGKWETCDLGWLVKAENFAKVLQGNYENKDQR